MTICANTQNGKVCNFHRNFKKKFNQQIRMQLTFRGSRIISKKNSSLHAGVRLLLGVVAGETEIGDAHVSVLVEEYVGGLEIAVDNGARVHVLEAEYDLGGVEFDLLLGEDAVLRQVVVQVAAVHEVEYEAELVGRVERVGHADDEGRAVAAAHRREHDAFVERQTLALLHLDALLVQALHCIHFAGVGLAAAVHFAEAAATDDAVHAEVVHGQLQVELEVLPLAEARVLLALGELLE